MATLRKRKKKNGQTVYWVDFYHNGRRIVKSTKTGDLATAKLILKDIEARIAKNTFSVDTIKKQKKVYLTQFRDEYLQYSSSHKAYKTYRADKLSLKNFIKFAGDSPLLSIDTRVIDTYANHRVQIVKKTSVNVELRHLKAAFNKAKQWGYIDINPFTTISLFKVPIAKPRFFNQAQFQLLLRTIDLDWLKHITIFAANTGVRLGELVNLEWSDVDFDNQKIKIGHKADFTTKSKYERILPLNQTLYDLLQVIPRSGPYIFGRQDGHKRDGNFISKRFKCCIRKAGLDERFTFHSLRHTFASHLVQRGVSLYIVSKLLGHSDIKMTEIYAYLAPEGYHDVVDLLDFEGKREGEKTGRNVVAMQKDIG